MIIEKEDYTLYDYRIYGKISKLYGKILVACTVILSALCFLCGCASRHDVSTRCVYQTRWLDGDTLLVVGQGYVNRPASGPAQHRGISREAAIADARRTASKTFFDELIPEESLCFNDTYSQAANGFILVHLKPFIDQGTVLCEEYDSENNCRILYQITCPGLRSKVGSAGICR